MMIVWFRAIRVWWVFCRYRLDLMLPTGVPWWLSIALLPAKVLPRGRYSDGKRLRLFFQSFSPIFVKFGQLLSTRPDLLQAEVADELKLLQDQVPPFEVSVFKQRVEQSLGKRISDLFQDFDEQPLACASLAQVHGAILKTGESVVIKVIRPDIEKSIQKDIALLKVLAQLVNASGPDGARLHLPDIVADYKSIIDNELNLKYEAANAQKLRDNFIDNPINYTPEIYWDYVRQDVLVSERIDAIPVVNAEEIQKCGIDLKQLAETGVEIFFTQVFEHNFFHADMHPGNIFVSKTHIDQPQYISLDCAIVGSLSEKEQTALAKMLLAVFKREYRKVALVQIQAGWVDPNTSTSEFEGAIRTVCEPIFAKPLDQISFADMLIELFKTARKFDLQMIPSLFLLEKTIVNIEGLGRQLYPQLDLWSIATPILERWSRKRYSPDNVLSRMMQDLPEWLDQFPEVPPLVMQALKSKDQSQPAEMERKSRQRKNWVKGLLLLGAGFGMGWIAAWSDIILGVEHSPLIVLALVGVYALISGND